MGDPADTHLSREHGIGVEARRDVEVGDSPAVFSDQDEELLPVDLLGGGLHEADGLISARCVVAGGCLQLTLQLDDIAVAAMALGQNGLNRRRRFRCLLELRQAASRRTRMAFSTAGSPEPVFKRA